MNTHPITLASGQHWSAPAATTLTVRCHAGTLWITTRDSRDDHILQAGECLALQSGRDILIGALTPATLDITSNLPLPGKAHGTPAISGRRLFGARL